MFARVQIAISVVLAAIVTTSVNAFAKGGFDFVTIAGPDLKEPLQVTDTDLTTDFFTFADFYEDRTTAPANPGRGYEITRHYQQGMSDIIFDRLHYYPETGFVFYDGIENGESEYDGEWYLANPDVKSAFESALAAQTGPAVASEKKQPVAQTKPVALNLPSSPIAAALLLTGLAVFFTFAFRRRKPSTP